MTCEELQKLLPDYWSRTLTDRTTQFTNGAVEVHLAECPNCRRESAYLEALWDKLEMIPVEAPGQRMRARFYESLDAYRWGREEPGKEGLMVPSKRLSGSAHSL